VAELEVGAREET